MPDIIVSPEYQDLKIFEGRVMSILGDLDTKVTELLSRFRVAYFDGSEVQQEDSDE